MLINDDSSVILNTLILPTIWFKTMESRYVSAVLVSSLIGHMTYLGGSNGH